MDQTVEDKALEAQKANSQDIENKFGDPYEFEEEICIAELEDTGSLGDS